MKKITLHTTATLKINVGNYETVDVQKTIISEVEYETPADIIEKSKNADRLAAQLLQSEAEGMLAQLGRVRIMKQGGKDTPVELWKSYVEAAPGTKTA